MKIALVGPTALEPLAVGSGLPAGYSDTVDWTPVCDLAQALPRRGHQVTVCTLNPHVTQMHELHFGPLRVLLGPMRPRARQRMLDLNAGEVRCLTEMLARVEVDVIHAHWSYEYALAASRDGRPALLTVHDCPIAVFAYTRNLYRLLRMFVGVRGMRSVGSLSTVSPYMVPCVRRITGREPVVVPNMVADSVFTAPKSTYCGPAPRILSVANGFDRRKNVRSALNAMALLRAGRPDARLVCVGADYEPGGPGESWARRQGVAEGVEFVGRINHDDLMRRLDETDVLVHPAREESFGVVLAEAMARGVPVVGGRSSGAVPWVVGQGGVLVDIDSAADVACGIEELLASREEYFHFSTVAYETARDRFSVDQVTSLYERIYQDVVA